ncbi:hypothetical protein [Chamaesiphon sp. VAR_48_metabat_403]|uniref:hypothetical protein n=1 Tax=Chamaesiphon sp. VAR_48_metabat_403 TaxID=2964700 RepID=UPI00286E92E7|nr:hypothetical protein [Chamaesiphon sp. VAR_48_metabat_403]
MAIMVIISIDTGLLSLRHARSRRCDSLAERLRQRDIGCVSMWFIAHRSTAMNHALNFTIEKAVGKL